MKNKKILLFLTMVCSFMLFLTSCGGVTDEQKENWTAAYNELETKTEEHNRAVEEINNYLQSISDNIKVTENEKDRPSIKEVVNKTFNLRDDVLEVFSSEASMTPPEAAEDFDVRYAEMLSHLATLNNRIKSRPSLDDIKKEAGNLIDNANREVENKVAKAEDILGLWGGLVDGEEYSLNFSITSGRRICKLSIYGKNLDGIFEIDNDGKITISVEETKEKLIYRYNKSRDRIEADIPKLGGWTNLPRVK